MGSDVATSRQTALVDALLVDVEPVVCAVGIAGSASYLVGELGPWCLCCSWAGGGVVGLRMIGM